MELKKKINGKIVFSKEKLYLDIKHLTNTLRDIKEENHMMDVMEHYFCTFIIHSTSRDKNRNRERDVISK